MIKQKRDFLGIKHREQKGKPHNLFSTNSIPNTAVVIVLKHKPRHSSIQTLSLQVKAQVRINGLGGPDRADAQALFCPHLL